MLIEKYKYQPLSRTVDIDTNRRVYLTPDGKRVPSVTTVLDKTKPAEAREALQNWRNRVGHAKAQAITTEAASRGTRMHSYLENYIQTDMMVETPANPFSWASHAMAATIIKEGLENKVTEFYGVEIPLYFPNALRPRSNFRLQAN